MTTTDTAASTPNPGEGSSTTTNTTAATTTQQGTGATAQPGPDGAGGQGEATGATGTATNGDGQKADPKDSGAAGAPEQYQAFALPEGFTLEGERLGKAQEFFKANGWTQEQAQQAVNLYSQMAGEDAGAIQTALETQRQQQIVQWGEESKAALGDKYDETVGYARTAVQAVGDEALTAAFDEMGWGNHPALIKAFAFFGRIARDSPSDTGGAGGGSGYQPPAARLWPDLPPR